MAIPKYVSAEEYSRRSGMGVEEVKRQIKTKKKSNKNWEYDKNTMIRKGNIVIIS